MAGLESRDDGLERLVGRIALQADDRKLALVGERRGGLGPGAEW
jgi:hypothetical protein